MILGALLSIALWCALLVPFLGVRAAGAALAALLASMIWGRAAYAGTLETEGQPE